MKLFLLIILHCFCLNGCFAQQRTLNYFISQGLSNSPLLNDLQNQIKLKSLDSLIFIASQKPQISFNSTNYYAPVINGYGYDKSITNAANITGLLSVNKTILNSSNRKTQLDNLGLLIETLRNNKSISEKELIKTITDQYIITYGDFLLLSNCKEVKKIMDNQISILKKLTQKNVYKQIDFLNFYINTQQNDSRLLQSMNQFVTDYATLNYLIGSTDTLNLVLTAPSFELDKLDAEEHSVLFQKYYLDSLSIEYNKKVLTQNYRPKVNVFADAGYNSSMQYLPYKNFGTSVGFSIVIPIYDGKQKRLQNEKLNIEENTRQSNKLFYTNQYQQLVYQLKQQLKYLDAEDAKVIDQLKIIATSIEANEKLLQTGDTTVFDLILSINNLINAKTLITDNLINRWKIYNQINYWQN